ncbi:unnamed protein product [Lymnaea stagnalis]|uniref:Succinate dehydrogenase assembly factor 4, mitochondrial n=1 Tax=Lymnaea stagnalis TaxID=6523 RepID=A0AAV2HI88_LYMST
MFRFTGTKNIHLLTNTYIKLQYNTLLHRCFSENGNVKTGARKGKTPAGKFDEPLELKSEEREPQGEKEPLERFPDNKNPLTGEIGGPRGPEPTRYGDWERKGRVTDF